jgi:exopolyphosphatase / guanosine-5'-triphosphate,3'-diphosphate pyrophosphatase
MMTKRVAAIDCGTNSLRLLIADIDVARHQLSDVERRMEIVRLGQGVDATGRLAPEALDRTLRALADYAADIRDAGVTAVRMVATSATRDASNAADFSSGVQRTLGIAPEVITGREEARLSFAGATAELAAADSPGLRPEPPYLVVDIGGGSTEFVLGGNEAIAGADPDAISVDIGCVRLTERYLHADPPTREQVEAATADIDSALEDVTAAIAVKEARTLVGLAGSVTTVTAIALGLPAQTHEQRAAIGALHPGRIDVIGAGALVLDRVMRRFGFTEMVASEHDILDGIAWSIAAGA